MKSLSRVLVPEGELLNVICDVSPLAWRRYQQRQSKVWNHKKIHTEDASHFPPFVCFRFEMEDDAVLTKLESAIRSYKGKLVWFMEEHKREGLLGRNWMVAPVRFFEVKDKAFELDLSSGEFLAKHEPGFGPIAYEDLNCLTEFVRQALGKGE